MAIAGAPKATTAAAVVLRGWKEIAQWLEAHTPLLWSEETTRWAARRRHGVQRLPVQRFGAKGKRSRVTAEVAALEEWARRMAGEKRGK